jgi:putative FmdB family regulatory protein
MPLYTYRCDNCGVQFDHQQSYNDPPITRCPECNKKTLRKVYTAVGIVFKGSGFYATDHRSPSGQSWSSSEKNTEKGTEKSDEKTKEVKKESEPSTSSTNKESKKE